MKRILYIGLSTLICLILSISCNKENKTESIEAVWELSRIETKAASIGDVSISVYLSFNKGSFELYQKIGEGNYNKFTGTYSAVDGKLSGQYSDGKPLASEYSYVISDNTLTLSTAGGKEDDIYKKISAIPNSVLENCK